MKTQCLSDGEMEQECIILGWKSISCSFYSDFITTFAHNETYMKIHGELTYDSNMEHKNAFEVGSVHN
jgi:hypothetical protein